MNGGAQGDETLEQSAVSQRLDWDQFDLAWVVTVGVALRRPLGPVPDEYRKVLVMAPDSGTARLVACQVAACTSVMPVSAVIDWVEA